MAQNARLAALTDELVHSILKFDPESHRQAYRHARDRASRGLAAHQYARTNQFDVQASFAGLDEKFRVLNRDDLADALDIRVKEINKRVSKWIPEYLSLLLHLSDRPAENSKLEALELLRPPTPPPELTWREILEDDPYSDEDIWKDIDYAADSSEDDILLPAREKKKPSPPTSVEDDDSYDPEEYVVNVDPSAVDQVQKAQFWKHGTRDGDEKIQITELQAIRETLFMLAGLQTSLYHADRRVAPEYELSHAMTKTANHCLTELGHIGRNIDRLRHWVKRPSSLPLVQTFEAAVSKRLLEYDQSLALLQRHYLAPESPITVSLLHLHHRITGLSRPMLRLAKLVAEIEPQLLVNPFVHLEVLFDQINLAQMTLEKDVFDFLARIFFECLQTYLKPMRRWMESGELGMNDETFFVFENDSGSEASSLWHDRFVLRRGQEDTLRSPAFLEAAAHKIFNTGKSAVFLKELGIYESRVSSASKEPRLDYETVCGSDTSVPLSPFSELFHAAFQTWIGSKYSLASNVLRDYLFNDARLLDILENFRTIYLSANGAVFQDFAAALFARMDADQRSWNDRFLLTELARGIFATALPRSQAERIIVRSVRAKTHTRNVKALSHVSLEYALPWPVMNILQRAFVPIYQALFTFLLQTHRAKYVLQRISPRSLLGHKLRHRLIWFADILRSYLTETVIDSSFRAMKAQMQKAEDIDEMAGIHVRFVAKMQELALLSDKLRPIHRAIIGVLDLAVAFAGQHDDMTRTGRSGGKKAHRRSAVAEPGSEDSDSSDGGDDEGTGESNGVDKTDGLAVIDKEFDRLLPFVTAGLRGVGRVGAEPAWEMLAERLEWDARK